MIKNILFTFSVLTVITGCATHHYNAVPYTPSHTNVALTEAAASVSQSLVQLAAIEQAANPMARVAAEPDPASYGMGQPASVDWSGPVGPLVEQLANATGYRVRVLGTAPAIPILVTINEHNAPVADILRDTAFQTGKRAAILVFPQTRIIEIRYENS